MLTTTQRGAAGEQLFAATVTLTSDGDLELYKPLTDDDHTDVSAGVRGRTPVLAIQVKAALKLNAKGLAVSRMSFPEGRPREHPAYLYVILYVHEACVDAVWVVPSADFNRLAYRAPGRRGRGLELEFMAAPGRPDKWSEYRCDRLSLGPRLLALTRSLRNAPPPPLDGDHLLLTAAPREAARSRPS